MKARKRRIRCAKHKNMWPSKGLEQRRTHNTIPRCHEAENRPLIREAPVAMGREDLIGPGKKHLVPARQPKGTGLRGEGARVTVLSRPITARIRLVDTVSRRFREPGAASLEISPIRISRHFIAEFHLPIRALFARDSVNRSARTSRVLRP